MPLCLSMRPRCRLSILSGLFLAVARVAGAQGNSSTVVVTPGAQYQAGPFTRTLFGSGWRDLWVTPVKAPVFDPATYAGGLKFDKRGGGMQTLTVHFTDQDGWQKYVFRSVDK